VYDKIRHLMPVITIWCDCHRSTFLSFQILFHVQKAREHSR